MKWLFILTIVFHTVYSSAQKTVASEDGRVLTLMLNKLEVTQLSPNETVKLMVSVNAQNTQYVLFQAHSQLNSVLLSTKSLINSPTSYGTYVTGFDIGLISIVKLGSNSTAVYLKSTEADGNVSVAIEAQGYGNEDAIPGGCNMEFEVETAPYLKLSYDNHMITVEYQRASVARNRSQVPPMTLCDTSAKSLVYDAYVYYMDERNTSDAEYLNAVNLMSNFTTMQQHAVKLPRHNLGKLKLAIPTYRRLGVVVNIVVHREGRNSCSPYVPIVSYGCNLDENASDSCIEILTSFEWVLGVMGAIAGLFFCFCGHRFFSITTFCFGFTTLSLVIFILLQRFADLNYVDLVSTVLVIGAIGGGTSFTVWWLSRSPLFTVLLAGLNLGFLLACVAYFTPLGQDYVLVKDEAYWPLFCCIMLVVPILFIGFNLTKQLHIAACSIMGSYALVVLLDRYAGGVLVYIVINVFRRAVEESYRYVISVIPFQTTDVIIALIWALVATAGIAVQWIRERRKPPFPIPPSPLRSPTNGRENSPQTSSEREPLISQNPHEYRKKRRNYNGVPADEERPLPYT